MKSLRNMTLFLPPWGITLTTPMKRMLRDLEKLRDLASEPKVVAWGEIGLDFFRRHSPPDKQVQAFERQLDIAFELDLPVIIHDRDAHSDLLSHFEGKERGCTGG